MNGSALLRKVIKPVLLILSSLIFFILGHNEIALVIAIIYLIDNFYKLNIYWRNEENKDYLIKSIDEAIEKNVANIMLPIALINEKGKILWHNSIFNELKDGEECLDQNILTIARGLNIDKIINAEKDVHQRLKLNGRLYDIYTTKVRKNTEFLYIVYFNDISELIGLDSTKESIVLIEVDNLSEALDTTAESDRPLVVAEIERTINQYANGLEAMIKKYENNMYIMSVQDKYIDEEVSNKFNILKEISKINKGNKMDITLSIGVGRGGISPQENYNFAVVAKELALGRGGDQVVVKKNEELQIFGGNSKEIEKRTRVRARVVSYALRELIYESSNIFIVGHKNPDMDCFGSALGLASIIKKLGKDCSIVLDNNTTAINTFLNILKEDEKYNGLFIDFDKAFKELNEESLVIIVDVHNKNYVSNLEFVEKAKRKVIIDHHRRSADIIDGTLLNYIEVYASSTSEMITEIIQYIIDKASLTEREAEGLLAGIYMDTKGFSFKTGVRTFDAASFLRKAGAETTEVKKLFTDNLEDFLKIADTIKSAEIKDTTAIAIAPDGVDTVIVAKSADELLNISGILAAFVIAKIDGEIYISARSVGDINVQIVLESLGGGGHLNMAGAKITGKTIDEVLVELKETIKKYLRVGE